MNEYLDDRRYLHAEMQAEHYAEQAANAEFRALEHHLDRMRARLAACVEHRPPRVLVGSSRGGYPEVMVLISGYPLESLYGGGPFEVLPEQFELPF